MAQNQNDKDSNKGMRKVLGTPKKLSNKPNKPLTRRQKLFRGPLFWILIAILVATFFGEISSAQNRFTQVKTSQILAAISKGDVDSAVIVDRTQLLKVVLKPGKEISGSAKVQATADKAVWPLNAEQLAPTQSAAITKVNAAVDSVTRYLTDGGIPMSEIEYSSASAYPQRWASGGSTSVSSSSPSSSRVSS